MLRWFLLLPVALALLVRFVMRDFVLTLSGWIDYDLSSHYQPLMAFALLTLTPSIVGVVIGFLLLDQRDDRTLGALQVTPLSLNGYLVYRLSVPVVIGLLITPVLFLVSGLGLERPEAVLLATIAAVPMAPLFAVVVAAFARNKVQGFALMKAWGGVSWPPILAYFVSMPAQLWFGLFPTFWAGKIYWAALAGDPLYWIYLPLGLGYQAILIGLALRRFQRTLHDQ